jgi:hypothetical protein
MTSGDRIARLEERVADLEAQIAQAREQTQRFQEQIDQACAVVFRDSILTLLGARGIPCPDEARALLEACNDVLVLHRRLLAATRVGAFEELLSA